MENVSILAHQVTEAARRLGIGRSLMYELIKAGRIKAIKIHSRTVITDAELRRFLAEAEAEAARQVAA